MKASVGKDVIAVQVLKLMYDIGMDDIRRLDPQTLLVFESLLETRSTTLSAARLNLSQSAVSGALKRLREIFDDPLFERHSRGLRPTARANELSIPIAGILGAMRNLSASLDFDPATAEGTVSFLATDYALSTIIAPIRDRLATVAPGLRVSVHAYSSEEAFTNSLLLNTDLLIGSPMMLPDTLQTRHLKSDALVLFMAPDHPLAEKTISLEDFVAYPHVAVSLRGRVASSGTDGMLASRGYARVIDTITPSFLSLPALLASGQRLAIAPRGLADVTRGALIHRPLPLEMKPIELYAAWHKRFSQDKRHIWLRRTLSEWFMAGDSAPLSTVK